MTTAEASLSGSFPRPVGARPAPVRRRAVAESQYYACDVTPRFFCHPDPAAFAATARPGQQYRLTMDGNRVAGSIALLDRPGAANGNQSLRDLADDQPAFCYAEGVRLRTTMAPSEFDDAVNVRFDRYQAAPVPSPPICGVSAGAERPQGQGLRKLRLAAEPLHDGTTLRPAPGLGLPGAGPPAPWDKGRATGPSPRLSRPRGAHGAGRVLVLESRGQGHRVQARLRGPRDPVGSPTSPNSDWTQPGRRYPSNTRGYAATATMPTGGPLNSLARERAAPSATPAPPGECGPPAGPLSLRRRLHRVSRGRHSVEPVPMGRQVVLPDGAVEPRGRASRVRQPAHTSPR